MSNCDDCLSTNNLFLTKFFFVFCWHSLNSSTRTFNHCYNFFLLIFTNTRLTLTVTLLSNVARIEEKNISICLIVWFIYKGSICECNEFVYNLMELTISENIQSQFRLCAGCFQANKLKQITVKANSNASTKSEQQKKYDGKKMCTITCHSENGIKC